MGLSRLLAILVLVLLTAGGCVPLPAALPAPGAIDGMPRPVGEPINLNSAPARRLEVRGSAVAPRLDGQMDAVWATTRPVRIPLAAESLGSDPQDARDVELRAVRTTEMIYFLARWRGEPPPYTANTTFNQLTIHWTLPVVAGSPVPAPACAVACHTAYVDGRGQVVYMNSETIPQGGQDALAAAGGWAKGEWAVAWSRPLVSANEYDLQFADLKALYLFFVKVFAHADDRPDLVSEPYALVFVPLSQ